MFRSNPFAPSVFVTLGGSFSLGIDKNDQIVLLKDVLSSMGKEQDHLVIGPATENKLDAIIEACQKLKTFLPAEPALSSKEDS